MNTVYCTIIGADVSDRTTKICVMSKESGKPKIVRETTIPTTPDGFSPTFHVHMKNPGICWSLGQRSSLHFCFRRISEAA